MLEVGLALRPQVDDDVEEGAAGAAHELGFRGRRKLEMHAAHGALVPILGDAGLGNERLHAALFEFLSAKAAGKEASLVLASFQLDDEGAFELGLGEDHGALTRRLAEREQSRAGASSQAPRTPSAISRWICPMR